MLLLFFYSVIKPHRFDTTIECLTPEQKREKNWGGFPMYHHCILRRAEAPIAAIEKPLYFPTVDNQELAMQASVMVSDILKANRIKLNMIFRMQNNTSYFRVMAVTKNLN